MTTDNENRRHEHIYEMQILYKQRPHSDQELADRLGTDRTNIFRIRKLMNEQMGIPIEPDPNQRGRYFIPKDFTISHIPLNRIEAAQLYLAGRRLQQQTRTSQRPVVSALEKLAYALNKSLAEKMVQAAEIVLDQKQDPQQEAVFATLVECWLEGIPVRITHRKLHGEPRTYRVYPYQLEPSVWGDGVYLIGHSEYHGKLATFKLTRIEKAVKGTGTFTIPEDFDIYELLNHAWGVWHADEAPQTVTLGFSAYVTPRVRESIWHPQQTLTIHDDGSSQWSAPVAEPREMIPWIRGWGADCEVVGPAGLRRQLVTEVAKLGALYGLDALKEPTYFKLWAKTTQEQGAFHPLLYHLLDVGNAAHTMWERALPAGEREHLSSLLGLSSVEAGNFFAYCAATHDIGKTSPGFQEKWPARRPHLEAAGFIFPPSHGLKAAPHGIVSTWHLQDVLKEQFDLPARDARRLAYVVGGHHGIWPTASSVQALREYDKGDHIWEKARQDLLEQVRRVFTLPATVMLPDKSEDRNAVLLFLSGLITAADWIGSMDEFFPYEEGLMEVEEYTQLSQNKAEKALAETGWMGWNADVQSPAFSDLFPFAPNEMQQTVFRSRAGIALPALMIIEAPTGLGKTEAALYLADQWLQKQKGKGVYVAMPTQATSNQMFGRTAAFLKRRYPGVFLNFHLLHGNAAWTDQMREVPIVGIGEIAEDGLAANSWFLPRKRSLLAPFGVGTVDQALLAVLQARHFYVRLFGLAHKVLIFDEVHAYDTYMNQIFFRLLAWLRVMGTSVIVLSATLPESTRLAMIAAYTGDGNIDLGESPYPRLTIASHQAMECIPLPAPTPRSVQIEWIDEDLESLLSQLAGRLAGGGCVAVICNTVGRAQELYRSLAEARIIEPEFLQLFHARTPFAWRKDVEESVLSRFGKSGGDDKSSQRPQRAIVVATQVIEQSLDLDFDLLITELAPIDLLIQRMGRLHRHKRERRPERLAIPTTLIVRPTGDACSPSFGGSEYVYERYILWQSWRAIQHSNIIELPADTQPLIEAVYGPFLVEDVEAEIRPDMQQAREKMEKAFRSDEFQAEIRLVAPPEEGGLVTQPMQQLLEDEDPRVHQQVRAATRLIGPTLGLVCLHRTPDGIFLEPDGSGIGLDLDTLPARWLSQELLQRVVTVQHFDIVQRLQRELPYPTWKESASLRYYLPVIFENGRYILEDRSYTLYLDREYGLRIVKETQ